MKALSLFLVIFFIWSASVPSADFDGDGMGDIAVFREMSGLWAVRGVTRVYFGGAGDAPVPGDFRGEGKDRIAIFRYASGLWAVRGVTRVYFGSSGDSPVPGDLNGDGTGDIAVFRPGSGLWAARGVTRFYFGSSADTAIPPGKGAGPFQCELNVTGQTFSYRTGDDGDRQAGAAFDFDIFTIGSTKITVDNNTGLIWASDGTERGCAFGAQTDWEHAVNWCNHLSFAGSSDWRLPNIKELQTIVDYSLTYPSINETYFPNSMDDKYWTSTTYYITTNNDNAWVIEFDVGGPTYDYLKTKKKYLRAVTGPEL